MAAGWGRITISPMRSTMAGGDRGITSDRIAAVTIATTTLAANTRGGAHRPGAGCRRFRVAVSQAAPGAEAVAAGMAVAVTRVAGVAVMAAAGSSGSPRAARPIGRSIPRHRPDSLIRHSILWHWADKSGK
jgi:hypothetical protein